MPGAELKVHASDRSRALKGLAYHKLAPGAEMAVKKSCARKGTEGFSKPLVSAKRGADRTKGLMVSRR